MGTCPVDPVAITTSARCVRLGWRTSAVVVHYPLCRSRHSDPASSRSDERAARGSACAGFPGTSRLRPPVHERNVSLPSLATPRSCLPRLSPYVAEAKKGERGTIRARVAGRIWSIAAEVDEACLVGMELELVPSKTLAQYIQNPLGILEVRERHYGVVGETDKSTFPLEPRLHLVLEPLVQHVVQENVR